MATENATIFSRIFKLYHLVSAVQSKSTKELYSAMHDDGFKVGERTIQRDLNALEDLKLIDSEPDATAKKWKLAGKNVDVNMTPNQALAWIMAYQSVQKLLPTEILDNLENQEKRALSLLNSTKGYDNWQNKFKVINGDIPVTSTYENDEIRNEINGAILGNDQIKIEYRKQGFDTHKEYQLNPLAIVVRDSYLYLVASKDVSPDKPQLFNFYRIKSAKNTFDEQCKPKDFSLDKYLATNTTGGFIWLDTDNITLKVKAGGYTDEWLQFNELHPTQKIEKLDDDWLNVTFQCPITYDLAAWVLRQTNEVVVTEPEHFVEWMVDRLEQTLNNY